MTVHRDSSAFLLGPNGTFVAELYGRYLKDPRSVDSSWADFFADLDDDQQALLDEMRGASWAPRGTRVIGGPRHDIELVVENGADEPPPTVAASGANGAASLEETRAATLDSIRALMLIRSYRVRGHLKAKLDPLGIHSGDLDHQELDPTSYGFGDGDWDREIFIDHVLGLETATLRQIMERVNETYCGHIGVEFMHIQEPDQKAWIQERIEAVHNRTNFSAEDKRWIYERLVKAEGFEHFLDKKYTGTKRFGVDGGESTIPALEEIARHAGSLGVQEIVIGMPHRGRLNVLANVMGKPYRAIFGEFEGGHSNPEEVQGSGDVKYHLGTSTDREFEDGTKIHLSLTANPSHLEAVDPVVVGKVRAKQTRAGHRKKTVMGLLMHGDAAFAGQGPVAETLMMSDLHGYGTGGTIHFVVNNQIGFTTTPDFGRSSPYCSDVAKMVQAPIFHVNGDDPEAVVHVARIAAEFRQTFRRDVVVDMFCYRRHGHNEGDEPAFTQPIMYRRIDRHPPVRQLYAEKLTREGVLAEGEGDAIVQAFQDRLEADFEGAKAYKPNKADWLEGVWTGMEIARGEDRRGDTAVELAELKRIGEAMTSLPEDFAANRKIERIFKQRAKSIESGEGVDWATAEHLAFGTLLAEGTPVRLSGQDSGRGTFSQRHAILRDQETEERYIPLAHIADKQAEFEVLDSPLSEFGVLGFEYGYSLAEPHALVLWEAQFGDFANGAQVIIDQFISSGEAKWLRMSGLTLLLPHGYEGQGPEHSSARPERFLQACAEDNLQVANCSTPANYFHILRRQVRRNFRKPLVLFTPKSLLRHKRAVSKLEEMGEGTTFHRVLWDDEPPASDKAVKRVVLCTGKVYYDLLETRAEEGVDDVYLLRVEQLYPFPHKSLVAELSRFPKAEVIWCQEEPRNMGYWTFVEPLIEDLLSEVGGRCRRARYAGRTPAAAPATGIHGRHAERQRALIRDALGLANE
jgi:2-oxoglutarate dehydrogenase E1 component